VSLTWRVIDLQLAIGFFDKKESNLFRLRAACDLRWLVFVVASGTAVALTEL
jgi:hypothetical protein